MATYPHAADHFVTLLRQQLTAADPVVVEQQVLCESDRLARALGSHESLLRIQTALDTAYRTRADSDRLPSVDSKLGGHMFSASGHVCDSLIAAWDSIAPIRPETSVMR